MTTKILGG